MTYNHEESPTPVLHDVTFSVEPGEFVAIMGPSGSGKSTLLHIMGFLDSHTSGTYRFNGKRMQDYTDNEVARIRNDDMGFIFQAFNLLARTSVYENVMLPLMYSDVPSKEWHDRTMKAIGDVDLLHRADFDVSRLSGGEKQRVAIARALVNDPRVIFADEPTGNLDTASGKKIMEILQHLNEEHGHTIVLITHETGTAEHARRIIRIVDGRIVGDHKVRHHRTAEKEFKK
ncbi:ABC transporter ATP-binding protein [Candidatus Peregrinibacteria bacterium]|nr:ABC transporter ATP-binding protein [Candidatus Peregrinibacteria bacterium]